MNLRMLWPYLALLFHFPLLASPSLWLAENTQQSLYLFGSVHLGDDAIYPLHKDIEQAFEDSQRLVIETDSRSINHDDTQYLMQLISNKGIAWFDTLAPHEQAQLQQYQHSFSLPVPLSAYRPWYVALQLTLGKLAQLGYQSALGLDLHFVNQAQRVQKPIVALETVRQQFTALSVLEKAEHALLQQTLSELPQLEQVFAKIMAHWQQGENTQLYQLLLDDAVFSQENNILIDTLLYQRNQHWLTQLTQLQGKSFVVVGALHLYGKQGLLDGLRKQGWQVKQLL